jgi:hypothetical protein
MCICIKKLWNSAHKQYSHLGQASAEEVVGMRLILVLNLKPSDDK